MQRESFSRGASRVELLMLLLALAAMTVLSGAAIPHLAGFFTPSSWKAHRAATRQIANFETALTLYAVDNGQYPTTAQGLDALIRQPRNTPHWQKYVGDLSAVPPDPWGNAYVYVKSGVNAPIFPE